MTFKSRNLKNQLTILLLTVFSSQITFGQSLTQYIPSDAAIVVTLDLGNLDKKVKLEQLRQYDFYKGMLAELQSNGNVDTANIYAKRFFNDPNSLGYDALHPMHFFLKMEEGKTYTAMLTKISNKATFEHGLVKYKIGETDNTIEQRDGFSFWSTPESTYAWNDNVVLQLWVEEDIKEDWGYEEPIWEEEIEEYPAEIPDQPTEYENEEVEEPLIDEELDQWANEMAMEMVTEEMKEAMATFANKILNRNFTSPLAYHPNYKSATASPSDVHFWMDYSFFIDAMQKGQAPYGMMGSEMAMAMDAMQSVGDIFYSNSNVSMAMNFQNGKMSMNSEMFMNDDMMKFYRNALDAKFNKKFLRYIEGGDKMFGYFFMNYNMKKSIEEGKILMHKALQAMPGYGQMADDAMKILGIFIDEDAIAELWKGDLMLAVSGMKMMEVTQQTYEYDEDFNFITKDTTVIKEMPVFTMLASYGNEKNVMKFVDLGLHAGVILPMGNYYKVPVPDAGGLEIYLALKDGVLIITSDQNLVANNLENGLNKNKRLSKDHRKMLCKSSGVIHWDIPNTLYAIANETPGSDPTGGYAEIISKQLDNFQMTSSKKVENSVKGEFNLNFVNKGTNSIQQFFDFVNDIYIEVLGGARI